MSIQMSLIDFSERVDKELRERAKTPFKKGQQDVDLGIIREYSGTYSYEIYLDDEQIERRIRFATEDDVLKAILEQDQYRYATMGVYYYLRKSKWFMLSQCAYELSTGKDES